jgi:hypothetical protein
MLTGDTKIVRTSSNRGELQGSNSATDARPSTAFYEKLAEIFSDSVFKVRVGMVLG